jgi:hypothetical protein
MVVLSLKGRISVSVESTVPRGSMPEDSVAHAAAHVGAHPHSAITDGGAEVPVAQACAKKPKHDCSAELNDLRRKLGVRGMPQDVSTKVPDLVDLCVRLGLVTRSTFPEEIYWSKGGTVVKSKLGGVEALRAFTAWLQEEEDGTWNDLQARMSVQMGGVTTVEQLRDIRDKITGSNPNRVNSVNRCVMSHARFSTRAAG